MMDAQNEEMARCLRAMCEGSQIAFDRFYSRYAPLVLRIAVRKLGDRMEAEDLCHDVFLEALRRGGRYDPSRGTVDAWLAVMTRSRCLDRLRQRSRQANAAGVRIDGDSGPPLADSPEERPELRVVNKLRRESLLAALETLPAAQRKAVAAAYLDHRSHRELADSWNVPLGTVKSWVRNGVGNIRKQLRKRGWLDTEGGDEDDGTPFRQ